MNHKPDTVIFMHLADDFILFELQDLHNVSTVMRMDALLQHQLQGKYSTFTKHYNTYKYCIKLKLDKKTRLDIIKIKYYNVFFYNICKSVI